MTKTALLRRASVLPLVIAVTAIAGQGITIAANAAPSTCDLPGVIATFTGIGTDTLTSTFNYDPASPIDGPSAVDITVSGPQSAGTYNELHKDGVSTIEAIDGVDSFALAGELANVANPINYDFLAQALDLQLLLLPLTFLKLPSPPLLPLFAIASAHWDLLGWRRMRKSRVNLLGRGNESQPECRGLYPFDKVCCSTTSFDNRSDASSSEMRKDREWKWPDGSRARGREARRSRLNQ